MIYIETLQEKLEVLADAVETKNGLKVDFVENMVRVRRMTSVNSPRLSSLKHLKTSASTKRRRPNDLPKVSLSWERQLLVSGLGSGFDENSDCNS